MLPDWNIWSNYLHFNYFIVYKIKIIKMYIFWDTLSTIFCGTKYGLTKTTFMKEKKTYG